LSNPSVVSIYVQVIFCYCSYILAVQLIRWIFHLDISFICCFKVISVLFCVSWSVHSSRSWWTWIQVKP